MLESLASRIKNLSFDWYKATLTLFIFWRVILVLNIIFTTMPLFDFASDIWTDRFKDIYRPALGVILVHFVNSIGIVYLLGRSRMWLEEGNPLPAKGLFLGSVFFASVITLAICASGNGVIVGVLLVFMLIPTAFIARVCELELKQPKEALTVIEEEESLLEEDPLDSIDSET